MIKNKEHLKITPVKIENEGEADRIMTSLGVSKEGIKILSPKSVTVAFRIDGISSVGANIIKQHLLSLGTDSAISREALVKDITTSTLIMGNVSQLEKLCDKLKHQPFNLDIVSLEIRRYLNNMFRKEFIFRARDKVLKIKEPILCGIVNITSDSFSGDGLLNKPLYFILKRVEDMIKEGACIIDVGGESSRPFSQPITVYEEIKRVAPVLAAIRKEFTKIPISVDTYKYKVAKEAVEAGADIINDITALNESPKILSLLKNYELGFILMHMQGMPEVMQIAPHYDDVIEDIIIFFKNKLDFLASSGVKKDRILLDPGIGFGKEVRDNLRIINGLYKFKIFGLPIFLGLSRKSFIGKVLHVESENRLIGTVASSVIALMRGAMILRAHDVAEIRQAVKIYTNTIHN